MNGPMMKLLLALTGMVALAGCADEPAAEPPTVPPTVGATVAVRDTILAAVIEAAGTVEPIQQASLSTRLMATVQSVAVQEGARVTKGQVLVTLDTRDLEARQAQVEAGLSEAEAVERNADAMARRIRALFADSAATRVQLEQAETGLTRAQAGVRTARAAAAELAAVRSYAEVRAPFAGVVTRRHVDAGAMATPGAPLVSVDDLSRLRVRVTAAPGLVRGLVRGAAVDLVIEGRPARATVEGIVASGAGNLTQVNVLVPNPGGAVLGGSAATILLPQGTQSVLVLPESALVQEGDLVGVDLLVAGSATRRWIRVGRRWAGGLVEVLSGVAAGDLVLVRGPAPGGS